MLLTSDITLACHRRVESPGEMVVVVQEIQSNARANNAAHDNNVGDSGAAVTQIGVCVRDHDLRQRIQRELVQRLSVQPNLAELSVFRLPARSVVDELIAEQIEGRVVLLVVREQQLSEVPALVTAVRGMNSVGVQLVCSKQECESAHIAPVVFGCLEDARSSPQLPIVVISTEEEPLELFRFR